METFSLEKMRYEEYMEKTSMQRKIEQIIEVNHQEETKEGDRKMEEYQVFWKRFLLRTDIIATVYVAAGILLNTQRNLFLDVENLN